MTCHIEFLNKIDNMILYHQFVFFVNTENKNNAILTILQYCNLINLSEF